MLVEFRVKNFRSLRDEQVLSLVASTDKTLLDTHALSTGLRAAPHLLKSAVVYGANASGKSNLIKALQYMRGVVLESAAVIQPGQTYSVQPFRLDVGSASQPTEFEVTFILNGVRYQYGFAMTSQRIVSEQLLVYKAFKPQRWFERRFDAESGKDVYEFGPSLKGAKSLWEGATRSNALFLSMAVQLNSDALRPVFDWFANRLVIFNEQSPLSPQFSVQMLKHEAKRKAICDFLRAADISIAEIDVATKQALVHNFHFDLATGKREEEASEQAIDEVRFHHVTEQGEAVFDLMDESSGTRNLLFLTGPILDILNKGLTLVVDELDTSLHTLLVQALVRLFHQVEVNTGGAQLIFTTHDTSLLDAYGLFRRDQIWFVEKGPDQSSSLYPLLDFSPRKNEAFERGYLQGRYGALPFLRNQSLGVKH
ncbi:ATP-binding protein [Pseudomonas sp. LjRoot71]|uniref:AAA family ATPase n=1 Tax=Pseudomonas TaxID=286 RepID=UPI001180AB38|nr:MULTISPECIES: ATP-binding protein [Pseudomonas]MBO8313460.1 ATP-binding protein [Pseudomonas aeruginosa]MBO8328362.1 ATP-binding protein [Pseudomonas aeruginosa]MBO8379758.1 ATP-binding protein [Pseudomonas aeruginosa]MBO8385303.1 ATP-binding protein [Pseudomonas aeruginosa]MBO8393073.1 ATP-binding protein [Pseudomonas aeruginosa]